MSEILLKAITHGIPFSTLNTTSNRLQSILSKTDLTGGEEGRASPLKLNTTTTFSRLHSIQILSNQKPSVTVLESYFPQYCKNRLDEVSLLSNRPSAAQRSCGSIPAHANGARDSGNLKNGTKVVEVHEQVTGETEVAAEGEEVTRLTMVPCAHPHPIQLTSSQEDTTRGPVTKPARTPSPSSALRPTLTAPCISSPTPNFRQGSTVPSTYSFTNHPHTPTPLSSKGQRAHYCVSSIPIHSPLTAQKRLLKAQSRCLRPSPVRSPTTPPFQRRLLNHQSTSLASDTFQLYQGDQWSPEEPPSSIAVGNPSEATPSLYDIPLISHPNPLHNAHPISPSVRSRNPLQYSVFLRSRPSTPFSAKQRCLSTPSFHWLNSLNGQHDTQNENLRTLPLTDASTVENEDCTSPLMPNACTPSPPSRAYRPKWEDSLQLWMVKYLATYKLHDLKKRGVLLNLTKHWRPLKIGHLLAENVPLYYFWQRDTNDFPCFPRLSPTILQAYHDTCSLDRTEVCRDDILGFQGNIKMNKRYDEFFQLRQAPNHTSSPVSSDIPSNEIAHICDFEDGYHLFIEVDDQDTYVTTWHGKPWRMDIGGGQRVRVLGPGVSVEAQRRNREICELFTSTDASTGKLQFDEWGRVTLVSRSGTVCDDYQGIPIIAEPSESQALLTRPPWVPPLHPTLSIPQPSSPDVVSLPWAQAMSALSSDHNFHRRSASPPRSHLRPASALKPWVSKRPLTWNVEVGYLISAVRMQARLRYWVTCTRDASTMLALLLKAVCHGLPFSIGVKVEDFGRFKPEEVSVMDHIMGKPTSAIETPFAYTAQGALHTYYMSRVNDITWQLHARILIDMGGCEARLGDKWGSMELITQFMDGPSPDVYLHCQEYIDSDDEHPMFLYMDEMTPQEIDILFGYIRSDSDRD